VSYLHTHTHSCHTNTHTLHTILQEKAKLYQQKVDELMSLQRQSLEAQHERADTLDAALRSAQQEAARAANAVEVHKADLKDLKAAHTALAARCDELTAREEAARAGKERAREQAATAQRRAERAKSSVNKLQAQLGGAAAAASEGAAAAAAAAEEGQYYGSSVGGSAAAAAAEGALLLQEEVQELRKVMRCSVCSARQKNCVITKCYHMFCKECVDENLRTRHRKCPACGKGFGADDVHAIWLT
jgi:E3 ubiquitin-protein ligase BRE1